jgi:serine protease Do
MEESFNRQLAALQAKVDAASAAGTGNSISGTAVSDGLTPSQVYARNVRSVVLISCEATGSYYGQTVTGQSTGSGFIMTADGYVMTNAHVVEGANKISVIAYDGTAYTAALCGTDTTNDVALLKIEGQDLPAAVIGSSDDLIVGDQVVAIGNPLGELTSTMTVGYVSAKDRDVTTDGTTINMIQTDAAINSGNSGGPLFNMKGEVVGITTAKYSGSSSSGATIEGIGFAIPINDVLGLVEDLMEYGYVKGAYMGVTIQDMDAQTAAMAEVYGLPVGPIIVSTEAGGAAEKAGILPNDIVTKIGDKEVSTVSDLTRALRDYEPGDTTTVTVYRSREIIDLTITFGERPAEVPTQTRPQAQPQETVPEDYYSGEGSIEDWLNPFFGWGG